MTIERKLLSTSPSGDAPNVAEVFSIDTYVGAGGTQTITNGIDLSGEGGLVWVKHKNSAVSHVLVDTERGVKRSISSDTGSGAQTAANSNNVDAFYSTGFQVGPDASTNQPSQEFVSWTFRKKKKFFDIVTYSGNGVTGRTVAHSLGSVPGMILIRSTNTGNDWQVWHTTTGSAGAMQLNSDGAVDNSQYWWNSTNPTSTHFTLAARNQSNNSSAQYVAYLFADNSSEDAEDQMIKCGGYTTSGSGDSGDVNLGWEPQFVLFKNKGSTGHWIILDSMRGIHADSTDSYFYADTTRAEGLANFGYLTSTGFRIQNQSNNDPYLYMAIRAPMMKEPETATEVFSILRGTGNGTSTVYEYNTGFPVDFAITFDKTGGNREVGTRVMGNHRLRAQLAEAQADTGTNNFDSSLRFHKNAQSTNYYASMWKRAKGFFDVVAWTGPASNVSTMPHSLGVKPELVIVKYRGVSDEWYVYHTATTGNVYLNYASSTSGSTNYMATTTDTVFNTSLVSNPANKPIAYLFATLAGISKVGGYTGNDSNNHVIDCGFTNGARWVLIKRLNATGQWYLFDSVRGITVGSTDPFTMLNLTNADQTEAAGMGPDAIQPHASGFKLTSGSDLNQATKTFLFYAIA